tara:strand:+ start:1106 stop:1369 length:264 start_codon:yes stop_codon:yes gene_type:complete
MYKKIVNSFYFIFIILLLSYVIIVYFSEDVSLKINQNRSNYSKNIETRVLEIPLLKNDTDNVINFNLQNNVEKKIKKRYFWNLLKDE